MSKNVELEILWCSDNQLTSLDVSKNTALTDLNCFGNQLTSLDVSKNTALTHLDCAGNQLTSLDVSKNTALTDLFCYYNQLTTLDVSKNMFLKRLSCFRNQLTSLDISKNVALKQLWCFDNQLTSLDVSKNIVLKTLDCYNNHIEGIAMDSLIAGLPLTGGDFGAIYPDDSKEHNVVTKAQVAVAKEKGWTTYYFNSETESLEEYEGSDPQDITPISEGENINFGTGLDENTNLDGTVVGNVFVNVSIGNGGFDPVEGCIIVSKQTDDSAIDGKNIFGEDFKAGYTGIVFKVAPGNGTVKVQAETKGNMVLKVKIGNNAPVEMELEGKLKVSFPYSVTDETYVYIYGGTNTTQAKGIVSADDMLKIYGIEVNNITDGIETITHSSFDNSPIYNLNGQRVNAPGKGIFIKNGKKVMMK